MHKIALRGMGKLILVLSQLVASGGEHLRLVAIRLASWRIALLVS